MNPPAPGTRAPRHPAAAETLRALLDASPQVLSVQDGEGVLRFVSGGVLELTGYTPDEALRQPLLGAVHPADAGRMAAALAGIADQPGATVESEYRLQHRDGSVRTVQLHVRNLLDDPELCCLLVSRCDVTARRASDDALRTRERHFRSLIENAHDLIALLEGDGDVRFASPSVERILGYERSALTGMYLFELLHTDDVPGVLEVFDRAIHSPGEPQWMEFRIRHRDGSWRTLEAVSTSLLHDPAVSGIVVNARDATERRRAEEELRASQQQLLQAQKMEAVGRLAGGVAHDFNNLLTAIRGNAELLLLDIPAGDARREEVEEITRAAERAAALTRQLLAFSRRQVLRPRVLVLNEVVREIERMIRRLIGEDVELVTRTEPALRPVLADPGQMEQVLLNLAVNARDAMPSGGRLTVQTGNVRVDGGDAPHEAEMAPGEYVMLAVIDTGHGMDADTRERAFEPFFTTKPAGRGTGLGLSTVYGIVKQSDGYVWIDSELGSGTTVRIFLPAATAAEQGEAGGSTPPPAPGDETVLLVEDEQTVRRLAVRVLRRAGYRVLEAGDGEEALRFAEGYQGPLDLLVTDVVMPRLGGRQLAAQLRAQRPGLPVLYVSGYNDDAVQRHGQLDPGTGFLPKPFTADELLARVRQALDERTPSAER